MNSMVWFNTTFAKIRKYKTIKFFKYIHMFKITMKDKLGNYILNGPNGVIKTGRKEINLAEECQDQNKC